MRAPNEVAVPGGTLEPCYYCQNDVHVSPATLEAKPRNMEVRYICRECVNEGNLPSQFEYIPLTNEQLKEITRILGH